MRHWPCSIGRVNQLPNEVDLGIAELGARMVLADPVASIINTDKPGVLQRNCVHVDPPAVYPFASDESQTE